jgi:hypothetical protein
VEFVATKPEFCQQGMNHLLMQATLSKGLTLLHTCVMCVCVCVHACMHVCMCVLCVSCALTSLLVSRQAAGLHKGADLCVK